MNRRELIGLIGCSAVFSAARTAQGADRRRVLAIQLGTSEQDTEQRKLIAGFIDELARLGWVEGHNLRLEYRWASGSFERVLEHAAELSRLAPDVIFAQGTPVSVALRRATRAVPVVFVNVADPVGSGLVDTLARPGGYFTGFASYEQSISGKWLEILTEIAPRLTRVLIIANPDNAAAQGLLEVIEQVAQSLGVQPVRGPARNREEIAQLMSTFGLNQVSGLLAMPDFLTTTHRDLLIEGSRHNKAPGMFPFRVFAMDGGLAAYSVHQAETFRQAAGYVDRILRGDRPVNLPVQAPTRFHLAINLRTARALGLEIPPTLIARADEVIE
jgi:putative ABC transport system substrate-binding protein